MASDTALLYALRSQTASTLAAAVISKSEHPWSPKQVMDNRHDFLFSLMEPTIGADHEKWKQTAQVRMATAHKLGDR